MVSIKNNAWLLALGTAAVSVSIAWAAEPASLRITREFAESALQYQPVECRFTLHPSPPNPWDPLAVGASAEILSPSGKKLTAYPFYNQDYEEQATPQPALARNPVKRFRIYVRTTAWSDARKVTLFIDDVRLVDPAGQAVVLGDFEKDGQGWSPGRVTSEKAHGDKQSLKVKLDLSQDWPGASLRPSIIDWSRFKELRFAVFPETDGKTGTVSVEFWRDIKKNIKEHTHFHTAYGALKLNQWNELVWDLAPTALRRELLAVGDPHFVFRVALTEPGEHQVRFLLGDKVVGEQRIQCAPASWPKPVRVSHVNRRYFETADGESLFLVGENSHTPKLPGHIAEYARIFPKLQQAGCNYVRFWVEPGRSLESERLGEYRLDRGFLCDSALSLAMQSRLYCLLCIQFHGDLRNKRGDKFHDYASVWDKNPYNAALGGPCRTPLDFMTNTQAMQFYQQRMRYIIARYGAYTNILGWQFWNEVDLIDQYDSQVVSRWHAEMADYVRGTDPYNHLITTSCASRLRDPDLWQVPQMDFIQTHTYHAVDKAQEVQKLVAHWSQYDKPYFPGEFGIRGREGHLTAEMDPTGLHLHNGFWAALASGAAGTPMSWWWDSYVDKQNLYHRFTPIARFVRDMPLATQTWRPAKIAALRYISEKRTVHFRDLKATPRYRFEKPTENHFRVARNGAVSNGQSLPNLLHGVGGHADKRNPPTFEVDYLKPGKFTVHIETVSQRAALEIALDGRLLLREELPAGEGLGKQSRWDDKWSIWYTTYNADFSVDVPAGKHFIKVDNKGRDWMRVGHYVFEGYETDEQPRVRVLGMVSDTMAILWLQNKDNTWLNHHRGMSVNAVEPFSFTFEALSPGSYRLEHWDTAAGAVIHTEAVLTTDGSIRLSLPQINTDLAVKLTRTE